MNMTIEVDTTLNHTWDYKKRTLQPCRPDYKSRLYTLYKGLKKRTLHSVNKGQQKQMVDFIKGHYKRLLKPVVDFVFEAHLTCPKHQPKRFQRQHQLTCPKQVKKKKAKN